jgi:hypothetical protein
VEQKLRYRRWRLLVHTLRRPLESITRQAWPGIRKVNERKADSETLGDARWNRRLRRQGRTLKDLEKTAVDRRAGKTWKWTYVSRRPKSGNE